MSRGNQGGSGTKGVGATTSMPSEVGMVCSRGISLTT